LENKFLLNVPLLGEVGSDVTMIAWLSGGNPYGYPLAFRRDPGHQWWIGFQLFVADEQFLLGVYGPMSYDLVRPWVQEPQP